MAHLKTTSITCLLAACLIFGLPKPAVAQGQSQQMNQVVVQTKQAYTAFLNQIPPKLRPLHAQLSASTPALRIKAVQSLALIGGDESALLLTQAIDDSLERSAAVRIEAAIGLGDIGGFQAARVLGIALDDKDVSVRKRAVQALRWAGTVFAIPYIQEALRTDGSVDVRLEAVRMLRKIGSQFSVPPLIDALTQDRTVGIRLAAADALGEIGVKERDVAKFLGDAYLNETDIGVRLEIVNSLGLVLNGAGLPHLEKAMQDRNLAIRLRATQLYGRVLGLQVTDPSSQP